MHTDLFTAELWQVTSVTDAAGGVALQVAGPLGNLRVILSRGSGRLRMFGIGEEVNYDVSALVKNIQTNRWFFVYQEAEPWMYVVVTDGNSGWYGNILRVETIIPSHMRQGEFGYHVVLGCAILHDEDKVRYVNGVLEAKD